MGHELQAFAVSLVALAAALVLATKELLLLLERAALRVGGKVYSVGDRIQIAGHQGVVLIMHLCDQALRDRAGPGCTSSIPVYPQRDEPGRIYLVLRSPAPDRGRSRIEQAILCRYLTAAATATNRQDIE